MLGRFLVLIVIIPLAELWLLMELTSRTSLWTTIAVVLTTGIVGMSLVRWQGISTWRTIHQQLASGQSPSRTIVSGVLILLAGALLLTPGLLTDSVGFALLIPAVRMTIATHLQKRFVSSVTTSFRSSVWVNQAGTPFRTDTAEVSDEAERPQVRVVDPGQPRLDEE